MAVCSDWLLALLQVPRPLAMKKEGIQTRKRKPKNLNKSQSGEPRHRYHDSLSLVSVLTC